MIFRKPIHFLSAGVAASVVGLGIALISGAVLLRGYAAAGWATADARIIRSEVVVTQQVGGIRRGAAVFSDYHSAAIEYEYMVAGQKYVGDEVGIAEVIAGYDPREAQTAVAKYPLGATVKIHYNPRQPSAAVINPRVNVGLGWTGVVLGLASLVIGAVVWMKAIHLDEAQRAATEIQSTPTPVRVAPARARPAAAPAIVPARELRIHWLIRTPTVILGLGVFFIGSLALSVSVKLNVPGAGPGGNEAAGIIAYGIVVAMTAGVTLLGAFLVWLGTKRSIRLFGWRSATPAAAAETHAVELPASPQMPDFGAFIAECGPQVSGQTHYIVCGIVMVVFGVLSFIAPGTLPVAQPKDAATMKAVMWVFGGFMSLGGIGMLWHVLFGQNQVISLFERGIIERVGATSHAIALDEIERLRVKEWYEHRFAPRTFKVQVLLRGEREFSFTSALRGQSERIIAYLAERIANTEMIPFQA